jgi:hypothetical protein
MIVPSPPAGADGALSGRLNAAMTQGWPIPRCKSVLRSLASRSRRQQSPHALRVFQQVEAERWWPIIKASNIKGDEDSLGC